ncbi:MAG: nitroreductase [Lachnospiraceae bacterium]|nr:nitroreductase [Lachnospiraceae bacterium]
MNEVIKAMKERRSIRKFKPEMPKKEDLDQIIEAGLYAASGMGKQSPIVVAVTNKEIRDKLSEANRKIGGWDEGFDPFYGAPAVLIVLVPKEAVTGVYDGSLVMGNLMLAAHSVGLGGIWIHRAKEEFDSPEYQQFLKDHGIGGEWEGIGHCAVGYIDGENPEAAPRRENRVFWVE